MNPTKIGIPMGLAAPSLSSASVSYTANQVRAILFEVSGFSVTINQVLWNLTVGVAGGHVGFGIYAVTTGSTTRGLRLADTGPISATVADQGLKATAFITPVTLPPGQYCLAFTADNASITCLTVNAAAWLPFNATPEIHFGTSATASVAGQLPALLGAITAAANGPFPTCMLSN